VEQWERQNLAALIERTEGNVSKASREAHVDRAHLLGLLKKYGLR
jgi:transcriptional regulator of acetoin/glycerol metabolism